MCRPVVICEKTEEDASKNWEMERRERERERERERDLHSTECLSNLS
jgi:hypothetical protein